MELLLRTFSSRRLKPFELKVHQTSSPVPLDAKGKRSGAFVNQPFWREYRKSGGDFPMVAPTKDVFSIATASWALCPARWQQAFVQAASRFEAFIF
jgi:hypothetical protein